MYRYDIHAYMTVFIVVDYISHTHVHTYIYMYICDTRVMCGLDYLKQHWQVDFTWYAIRLLEVDAPDTMNPTVSLYHGSFLSLVETNMYLTFVNIYIYI